jgi:hypothetical protein
MLLLDMSVMVARTPAWYPVENTTSSEADNPAVLATRLPPAG